MTALIDNYTVTEPAKPSSTVMKVYRFDIDTSTFSVVAGAPKREGINSRIHKLLKEYSTLQDNWDDLDSLAPNAVALQWAKHLTCVLGRHGQPIFHAAPGPNGEIMLDIRNFSNNRTVEIIFYADRSTIVFFSEDNRPTQEHFIPDQLPKYLEWLYERHPTT
jgi:hypothetical protein